MSAETEEFLQGLYGYDEAGASSPYVNWTNGFEATPDEYSAYVENGGSANTSTNSIWQSWE
ncbi:MAG TPA: hypothetical protein VM536_14350 [Chloroflexia bacterium]|nr:hypothetical protein [Chloroflexia bacterium]